MTLEPADPRAAAQAGGPNGCRLLNERRRAMIYGDNGHLQMVYPR
jgi:hypothetical protein